MGLPDYEKERKETPLTHSEDTRILILNDINEAVITRGRLDSRSAPFPLIARKN